jgi:Golgi phosphoprotein 3
MTSRITLPHYEEILLLAMDDDKGTTGSGGMFVNAMGGAILAELAALGAITLDEKSKVTPKPGAFTEDPILAEALAKIGEDKKTRKAGHWVSKFAAMKDLRGRTARQLVAKGVLREEVGTVLKIFKRAIFPEADSGPEQELIARLEEAIFTDTLDVDHRTVIIVALANATDMLNLSFDKKRLKQRKERIKLLASGELVGNATKEVVQAIQATILVAVILPVIISTTASTS